MDSILITTSHVALTDFRQITQYWSNRRHRVVLNRISAIVPTLACPLQFGLGHRVDLQDTLSFDLELPCEVVTIQNRLVNLRSRTTGISSTGTLLSQLPVEVAVGDRIEYIIYLPGPNDQAETHLRCFGRIVRVEPTGTAVTLERHTFERIGKNISVEAKQILPAK